MLVSGCVQRCAWRGNVVIAGDGSRAGLGSIERRLLRRVRICWDLGDRGASWATALCAASIAQTITHRKGLIWSSSLSECHVDRKERGRSCGSSQQDEFGSAQFVSLFQNSTRRRRSSPLHRLQTSYQNLEFLRERAIGHFIMLEAQQNVLKDLAAEIVKLRPQTNFDPERTQTGRNLRPRGSHPGSSGGPHMKKRSPRADLWTDIIIVGGVVAVLSVASTSAFFHWPGNPWKQRRRAHNQVYGANR